MKIAIGICGKTSGRCSSMGCFKAYNNKDKHFAIYKEEGIETELLSFFSCNLCFEKRQDEENNGEEKLKKIGKKLKESNVERGHLGKCAVKCKEDRFEEIKKVFSDLDIDIIEGTH